LPGNCPLPAGEKFQTTVGKLLTRLRRAAAAHLTGSRLCDLLSPLQPKSGFLPEARHGRPKFLGVEDGANEVRQLISRPLSRPSPTANLVGNWKGDPLDGANAPSSRSPH
jgi:hypothetical protein